MNRSRERRAGKRRRRALRYRRHAMMGHDFMLYLPKSPYWTRYHWSPSPSHSAIRREVGP